MSEVTHTPGPWSVTDNRSLNGAYWIEFDFACSIAEVRHGGEDTWEGDAYPGTPEANARLISAAPELLEALEDLCDWGTECTQDKWDKARAAIAKARGQS